MKKVKKKNKKQCNLFNGFEPVPEKRPITEADLREIFNGKVLSEEEYAEEVRLLKMNLYGRSGEGLVNQLQKKGVFGWVKPDENRVKWYKGVFAEDKRKRDEKKK